MGQRARRPSRRPSLRILMLVATLMHLDKFHFDSSDSIARGAA
jgi:hypothetical protein